MNRINSLCIKYWKRMQTLEEQEEELKETIFLLVKEVNKGLKDFNFGEFNLKRWGENYIGNQRGTLIHLCIPDFPGTFSTGGIFLIRTNISGIDNKRGVINLDKVSHPKEISDILIEILQDGFIPQRLIDSEKVLIENEFRKRMSKKLGLEFIPYSELRKELGLK